MLGHSSQLLRFCAISVGCFALGLGVLTGLHELLGVHYLAAYVSSFAVTSTAGYLLNGHYTFRTGIGNHSGLLRYMTVNLILLVINGAALRYLVEHVQLWYLAATCLLAGLNTPVSFLAHRLVSYRLSLKAAARLAPSPH